MSTSTFVNALIGLAREYKMKERRAKKNQNSKYHKLPAFGHEVAEMMSEDGYFQKDQAQVFGDVLEDVLRNSTPQRKKK